jgi:hypothetical protein
MGTAPLPRTLILSTAGRRHSKAQHRYGSGTFGGGPRCRGRTIPDRPSPMCGPGCCAGPRLSGTAESSSSWTRPANLVFPTVFRYLLHVEASRPVGEDGVLFQHLVLSLSGTRPWFRSLREYVPSRCADTEDENSRFAAVRRAVAAPCRRRYGTRWCPPRPCSCGHQRAYRYTRIRFPPQSFSCRHDDLFRRASGCRREEFIHYTQHAAPPSPSRRHDQQPRPQSDRSTRAGPDPGFETSGGPAPQLSPTVFAIRPGFPWKENSHLVADVVGEENGAAEVLNAYQ